MIQHDYQEKRNRIAKHDKGRRTVVRRCVRGQLMHPLIDYAGGRRLQMAGSGQGRGESETVLPSTGVLMSLKN